MGQGAGIAAIKVAEVHSGLPEPVAAAPARNHQRHRGSGNGGIAVANQFRQQRQAARPGVTGESTEDALLVSAAQHQPDETRAVK